MSDIMSNDWHVVPVNDLRDHAVAEDCWCEPTEDEGVWVHHSLDHREKGEPQ